MKIEFKNVSFNHRGTEVFTGVNFSITEKNYHVKGEAGAGKTLLLRALAFQLTKIKGNCLINHEGHELKISEYQKLVHLLNFPGENTFSYDNGYYYQQRYHSNGSDGNETLLDFLITNGYDKNIPLHNDLVKRSNLISVLDRHTIELSNGERKKMLFLKSLFKSPKLLLLDNPCAGLDKDSRDEFHKFLHLLSKQLHIQLLITGRDEDIPGFIDHEIQIKNKKVIYTGERKTVSQPIEKNDPALLNKINKQWRKRRKNSLCNTIFELKNVTVAYGDKVIINDLSWSVLQGERIAFTGNNGTGKSTLLSLVFADNPKSYANDIYLFGRKRGSGESIWSIKENIGFVSSELHMYTDGSRSVLETVLNGFYDTFFRQRKISKTDYEWADLLLQYFNLNKAMNNKFELMSFSQQRLILFIRALVQAPELLLLDEPYQGLDWSIVSKCNNLLKELYENSPFTLIFVSHYMEEIPEIVTRHVFLEKGKLNSIEKKPI